MEIVVEMLRRYRVNDTAFDIARSRCSDNGFSSSRAERAARFFPTAKDRDRWKREEGRRAQAARQAQRTKQLPTGHGRTGTGECGNNLFCWLDIPQFALRQPNPKQYQRQFVMNPYEEDISSNDH